MLIPCLISWDHPAVLVRGGANAGMSARPSRLKKSARLYSFCQRLMLVKLIPPKTCNQPFASNLDRIKAAPQQSGYAHSTCTNAHAVTPVCWSALIVYRSQNSGNLDAVSCEFVDRLRVSTCGRGSSTADIGGVGAWALGSCKFRRSGISFQLPFITTLAS